MRLFESIQKMLDELAGYLVVIVFVVVLEFHRYATWGADLVTWALKERLEALTILTLLALFGMAGSGSALVQIIVPNQGHMLANMHWILKILCIPLFLILGYSSMCLWKHSMNRIYIFFEKKPII